MSHVALLLTSSWQVETGYTGVLTLVVWPAAESCSYVDARAAEKVLVVLHTVTYRQLCC